MSDFELFSRRQKRQQSYTPDIYQYDTLPEPFRVQVFNILRSTIGIYQRINPARTTLRESFPCENWEALTSGFMQEIGTFHLGNPRHDASEQCKEYLLMAETQNTLDFIEYAFHFINHLRSTTAYQMWIYKNDTVRSPDDAIEELNRRFQEHCIGYYFANGKLIKQTDQYLHTTVTLPTLLLLQDPLFKGAQEEFLNAHQHYLKQRYKEAITEALKAFESVMKTICKAEQWSHDPNATAKGLLTVLFDQNLIPPMLQNQFNQLRGLLESGIPTVRNKTSGHGQGSAPVIIPEYIAAYALHTTAANIVLLFDAYKEMHQGKI